MNNPLFLLLLSVGVALGADIDPKKLQQRACAASTAEAHAKVASDYASWADTLTAKARQHEREAERLSQRAAGSAMRHKWPAMVTGPADRERRLAMQAHRAAREARAIAQSHSERATAIPADSQ
ncbi:MAG: hypothetical protein NTV52_09820 [Acidobacteria bacterium]|nr:hypothetical protein [Acidobacteriota bacterium]